MAFTMHAAGRMMPKACHSIRPSPLPSHSVRHRHTAVKASGSLFSEKDKTGTEQTERLKQSAERYLNEILGRIKTAAADNARAASSSSALEDVYVPSREVQALRSKVGNAIRVLQQGLVERDTEVRLLMLAALAGEHVLFIGPPGTAKSEVGRRLSSLLQGTYFERLLTRFSVPEELFGPLSMRALEEDKYVRQTRGYLPEAQVAFIDEIFKANSAILNTLLTILNERLFDNGSQRVQVPLVTMVGASNELPESEELDALYDRFLIRKEVKQVTASGLGSMLDYYAGNSYDEEDMHTSSSNGRRASSSSLGSSSFVMDPSLQLTPQDFDNVRKAALQTVRVPQRVIQMIGDLRTFMQDKTEPPVYVSDRRLVKAMALMQVAAYCNGRDKVSEYDCLLLEHVLWQKPEHAARIGDWLLEQLSADDSNKQVEFLLTGLFGRTCKALGNAADVEALKVEVSHLRGLLQDQLLAVAQNLEGGFPVVLDNLWMGPEEANALATALQPKLQKAKASLKTLLQDAVTLEVAIEAGCDAVVLANLMPRYWASFIRNSPLEEVKPIGTTKLGGRP